jgi:hypothetical protein
VAGSTQGRPDRLRVVRVGDFPRGRGVPSSGPRASRNAVEGAPFLHVCGFSRDFAVWIPRGFVLFYRGFWVPLVLGTRQLAILFGTA